MTKINNVPAWAWDKKYIIARDSGGEWWFFHADDSKMYADITAWENHGETFLTAKVERERS